MRVTIEESQLNEMIERLKSYQKMQNILINGLCKIADSVDGITGNPHIDKVKIIFTNTTRQFFKTTRL